MNNLTTEQFAIATHHWNGMLHMVRTFTKEEPNISEAMNIWPLSVQYALTQNTNPITHAISKAFQQVASQMALVGMPMMEQVFAMVSEQILKEEDAKNTNPTTLA